MAPATPPHGGPARKVLLLVDDEPQNLLVLAELLSEEFRVLTATSGPRALQIMTEVADVDLVLLDIMMPAMDGYEVLRRLKADPKLAQVPVIFVTAMAQTADEETGLRLGAVDYITKPVSPPIVLQRVRTHLELKAARDVLRDQNQWLERELAWRMQENQLIQEVTIEALAGLAEVHDPETGLHVRRTREYVRLLGRALQENPAYRDSLPDATLARIVKAAPLHDLGKVGIPLDILRKPASLTEAETSVMRHHPEIGAHAIEAALQRATTAATAATISPDRLAEALAFLNVAIEIARTHHEKWDGSGYPAGLAGAAIPLSARLMMLADVYDALMSRRAYKPAMPEGSVIALIQSESGHHFDPDIVDAFLAAKDAMAEVAQRMRDPDDTPTKAAP
jgi:putative two-component system response regulator